MAEIVENIHLGTRQKLELILQEMDTISREIISQLHNSSSTINNDNFNIQTLLDMLIERQDYLTQQIIIVHQHEELERQIQIKRDEILKCEGALHCLQTYLLQAVQVLSSAVYQAREKIENIHQSKSFPSETIIRYAHQLATCYSTTAPENWQQGDIRRPYPTNVQMRQGLLAHISEQTLQQQQINVQIPTTVVDSSVLQTTTTTTTSSYTTVTTAARPPKHDTTSFASDIFSGIIGDETNNINLSSSDTDSDNDLL